MIRRLCTGVFVCVLAHAVPATAQQIAVVPEIGITFSTLPGFADAVEDPQLDTGLRRAFTGGVGFPIRINDRWNVRPLITFTSKGMTMEGGETRIPSGTRIRLDYLEVSAVATVKTHPARARTAYFFAGPFLGFNTKATISGAALGLDGEEVDLDDEVSNRDAGILIGVGFGMSAVQIEARYSRGLTDLFDSDARVLNDQLHTSTFSLHVGFPLRF